MEEGEEEGKLTKFRDDVAMTSSSDSHFYWFSFSTPPHLIDSTQPTLCVFGTIKWIAFYFVWRVRFCVEYSRMLGNFVFKQLNRLALFCVVRFNEGNLRLLEMFYLQSKNKNIIKFSSLILECKKLFTCFWCKSSIVKIVCNDFISNAFIV